MVGTLPWCNLVVVLHDPALVHLDGGTVMSWGNGSLLSEMRAQQQHTCSIEAAGDGGVSGREESGTNSSCLCLLHHNSTS